MAAIGFALCPTAIGDVGVVWSDAGLTGILIPEASTEETRRRMTRLFPSALELAPPPPVRQAMDVIAAIVSGKSVDAGAIALDMEGIPEFSRRVYEVTAAIPMGRTMTYGEVAARLGDAGASRAVGQALGKNPFPIVVPCHRVLAAGGKSGGFSAPGGVATKRRLLEIEGAQLPLGGDSH
jgi:methylated-DNA-[protein]-cysteine S-methyltransferase